MTSQIYDFKGFIFPLQDFKRSYFNKNCDFRQSEFHGGVDFRGTEFLAEANFHSAVFNGPAGFHSGSSLGEQLSSLEIFSKEELFFLEANFTEAQRFTAANFTILLHGKGLDLMCIHFAWFAVKTSVSIRVHPWLKINSRQSVKFASKTSLRLRDFRLGSGVF